MSGFFVQIFRFAPKLSHSPRNYDCDVSEICKEPNHKVL